MPRLTHHQAPSGLDNSRGFPSNPGTSASIGRDDIYSDTVNPDSLKYSADQQDAVQAAIQQLVEGYVNTPVDVGTQPVDHPTIVTHVPVNDLRQEKLGLVNETLIAGKNLVAMRRYMTENPNANFPAINPTKSLSQPMPHKPQNPANDTYHGYLEVGRQH